MKRSMTSLSRSGPATAGLPGVWSAASLFALSAVPVMACDADLDRDGSVSATDLAMLLASWGDAGSRSDLDGDGLVAGPDLSMLLTSWGDCGRREVLLMGSVRLASGEPLGAAVVVDDEGAMAVSDLTGAFELSSMVDGHLDRVTLRIDCFDGGRAYEAEESIAVSRREELIDLGTVTAWPLDPCEEFRWHAEPGFASANGWIRSMSQNPIAIGELVVAGQFTEIGGEDANRLARWDGSSWWPFGGGMNDTVWCLEYFDDGNGLALYAGGSFTEAGGTVANRIARWDGRTWAPVGAGFDDGGVRALGVFDDGSGPALYAAGWFTASGGCSVSRVAKWDGRHWTSLGEGVSGGVYALAAFEAEGKKLLIVGGVFDAAGGVAASGLAGWDGYSWQRIGQASGPVYALAVQQSQSGRLLYAGGDFMQIDDLPTGRIARWDGIEWSSLGRGADLPIWDIFPVTVEGVDRVLVGGLFDSIDGIPASSIAMWNGQVWQSLGDGLGWRVDAISIMPPQSPGLGPQLIVGGWFPGHIARWECQVPNQSE